MSKVPFKGGVTKGRNGLSDAVQVGTKMRNIRGGLTRRAKKAPPVTLSPVRLVGVHDSRPCRQGPPT